MSHKVCIDPADRACVDTSDLEQGGHLWVACSSFHEKDITHPPGLLFCHDNAHAWFDAQEEGVLRGFDSEFLRRRFWNPVLTTL